MENASVYATKFLQWAEVSGPKLLGAIVVFIIGLYITNFLGKLTSKGLKKKKIAVDTLAIS